MPFPNRPQAIDKNPARSEVPVADDPRRAPDGIYSGATKRLAISDGAFVEVNGDVKSDYRNRPHLSEE
jgi:hypothetical protein